MSTRFLNTFLAAMLFSGVAVAKQPDRRLLDEDRYLYAQPDAAPAPAHPARSLPVLGAPSDRESDWRSNANGS